jgi:hypothetical protein
MTHYLKFYSPFIALLLLGACQKEKNNRVKPQIVIDSVFSTLEANLADKEFYTLDLKQYGIDKDISAILEQANSYTLSTIDFAANDTRGIYTYQYDAANLVTTKAINPSILDSVLIKVEPILMEHGCGNGGMTGNDRPHEGKHEGGKKEHHFLGALFHDNDKHEDEQPTIITKQAFFIKVKFTISGVAIASTRPMSEAGLAK